MRSPSSAASTVLLALLACTPSSALAQTIRGRLLDAESSQPIDLGILSLFTASGDSVSSTASDRNGFFSISAPEPGSFMLRASAFGYGQKQEGIFELGDGGRLDVEFRIARRPVELEEILVPIDQPIVQHPLVLNGFTRRYELGLGHFITPQDLARTVYRETEALFHSIPGVRVVPSRNGFASGDQVLVRDPQLGWCAPMVILDGIRTRYNPAGGETLTDLVPISSLAAAEVYTSPAEIPAEYGMTASDTCGVLVLWTKR